MIPKKSSSLYKEVSEALNQDESLVEDIVEFYYSELRKTLSNLTHPRINVEGLGHFVAKTGLVRKSIPKYTNILKNHDTSTYGAYFNKKMIETKLELLIQLEHKILLQEIKKDEFKKTKNENSSENNLGE
jgi:fructose-specific phosphotransferase system component IIB